MWTPGNLNTQESDVLDHLGNTYFAQIYLILFIPTLWEKLRKESFFKQSKGGKI